MGKMTVWQGNKQLPRGLRKKLERELGGMGALHTVAQAGVFSQSNLYEFAKQRRDEAVGRNLSDIDDPMTAEFVETISDIVEVHGETILRELERLGIEFVEGGGNGLTEEVSKVFFPGSSLVA